MNVTYWVLAYKSQIMDADITPVVTDLFDHLMAAKASYERDTDIQRHLTTFSWTWGRACLHLMIFGTPPFWKCMAPLQLHASLCWPANCVCLLFGAENPVGFSHVKWDWSTVYKASASQMKRYEAMVSYRFGQ